ncbi:HD-GYP domain-containing protein [Bacillus sp. HMF5848]|uniref:HD-GYP domain-containing protein n=1 Tax=Bacillus sp. HMF5848 TaxID=2495421 RepID=UPI000F7687C9|nr:HD-GYP domain-containing protein [Bacillus sp. HMF5848]RSK28448.1 HD-GYP domain-containing protein [Bacillus sp. HMF5848]
MRLETTHSLHPGTALARQVLNEYGQVLINKGVPLTTRMIQRLQDMGISYVYVEDARTNDIEIVHPISEQLRRESIQSINDIFNQFDRETNISHIFIIDEASKQLLSLVRKLSDEIYEKKELVTLLADVFIHDRYIFTHSLNVTLYSIAIAIHQGYSKKDVEIIALGALMHDVGKMLVPQDILMKPSKLTEDEFSQIKKHSSFGFDILRKVNTVSLLVAHCAYQHHERINGSGYPRGLKGEEIHPYAKIIAVADVFDAVTSNRVYRNAMLPHEGLEILYSGVGTLYDVSVVEAFRKAIAIYPVGLSVILSDGRSGIVSKQNHHISERPVIRILKENDAHLEVPYEVDLSKHLDVMISDCDTTLALSHRAFKTS